MNARRRLQQLWSDVRFLLARLLVGIGAYALLAAGLVVGGAVGAAVGAAAVVVVPVAAGALAVAALGVVIARRFSGTARGWAERRSLRRAVIRSAAGTGRVVATAVAWWLLRCRVTARRERARVAAYRQAEIPIAYRPLPDGRVSTLRVLTSDPATWRDSAYLVVGPAAAAAACLLVGGVTIGAVTTLVSAFTDGLQRTGPGDPSFVFTVAAGIVLLLVSPLLAHVAARGVSNLGAALLSTGEGARMRAELDEQRLRRQLAVDAAEAERRRIERDLHDGAQQRLVALGMGLGLAREALPADPGRAAVLVAEAHAEAKLALSELRDLARGIHPAILADRGLDAALSALLRRTRVPVSILVAMPHRPPSSVESAAYFVVAEALTNACRQPGVTRATVSITQVGTTLVVEVTDDGAGGADPAVGTGLTGLADRVAALNGRIDVDSPPGGPTTIRAEIPCGS